MHCFTVSSVLCHLPALIPIIAKGLADCLQDHLIGAKWICITGTLQVHLIGTLHVQLVIHMVPSGLFTVTGWPELLMISIVPPEHHRAQSYQCAHSP